MAYAQEGRWASGPRVGTAWALGAEIIHEYAGQEQVDLAVVVDIPGSWFGGGMAASEKKEKYTAQAVEFAEVHEFKKAESEGGESDESDESDDSDDDDADADADADTTA